MNKLSLAITAGMIFLASAMPTFAQPNVPPGGDVEIKIRKPDAGINPEAQVGDVLTNVISIIFVVAVLAVLFFLIFGAFKWITSGGDKDGIKGAREMIINALVGLAILAIAFLIARVVGQLIHVDLLNLTLPVLDKAH